MNSTVAWFSSSGTAAISRPTVITPSVTQAMVGLAIGLSSDLAKMNVRNPMM